MIEKISEKELEFIESYYDSQCMIECLFTDLENDNLAVFDNKKFSHVRIGQLSFLSYEYSIDYNNPELSAKENFKQREGTGNVFCLGGRNYGKTLFTEKTDLIIDMIIFDGDNMGFCSYDALHIEGVLEGVIQAFENHPFLKMYNARVKRNPYYIFLERNKSRILGINMNLSGENPGAQFFQKHFIKLYMEEASFETQEVYEKRLDSVTEHGCVAKKERILLADLSTKPIEEIKIGDKIFAWDEKLSALVEAKVLNNIYQGKKDVIQIKNDITSLWLTPDHRIRCISEGDRVYSWREAVRCSLTNFYCTSFAYIDKLDDYYRGILVGLIESDGSHYKIKGKFGIYDQYVLFQSDEVDFFRYLLNYLKITYTEDLQKDWNGKWNKPDKPSHIFRIRRENNNFINNIYFGLENNKDVQYGFIAGFVIGDGWIDKKCGAFNIGQSIKNIHKIDLIEKILKKLNFHYNRHIDKKQENVDITFSKYSIPFFEFNVKKCKKYKRILLNTKRPEFNKSLIKLNGFREGIDCYDLTTTVGSFIANGFIVHNCVNRFSGMTNFTKYSPPGRIYYEPRNRNWIVNYPQYVNPNWDTKTKEKAIKEHGGEQSVPYRLFVRGEIVEDYVSAIDMERVRKNYNDKKVIKNFEITKENYKDFNNILVVERPSNAELIYICADIGETAATEIIIISKVNETYHYLYNITVYNLTDKEQFAIFRHLTYLLNANIVAMDCTEGLGRAIFRSLEEIFSRDNLVWVGFNEKIPIDVIKDEQGNIIFEDGKPVYKQEMVDSWSVKRLKDILYEKGKIELPLDYKLDSQLNSIIIIQIGNKTHYESAATSIGDHLFAAWKVFAIAEWMNSYVNIKSIFKKTFSKIGF